MKVFIDTSLIIDHLRTFATKHQSRFMEFYSKTDGIYFSLISVGEVYSGKSVPQYESEIRDLFALGQIIDMDVNLMKEAGNLRRDTGISLIDAIIAASAIALDIPVATLNLKDFFKVKGLRLYKKT